MLPDVFVINNGRQSAVITTQTLFFMVAILASAVTVVLLNGFIAT
jgi:hypothetical protein